MSYAKKEEHEREKTLNELMTDLSVEVRDLFRQEMLLAKNEMSAKISRGVNDMKSAAIVIALGNAVSYWLSALIVGVVALVIGYYMVKKGLADMRKIDITPQQTISSFREDEKWLKRKI